MFHFILCCSKHKAPSSLYLARVLTKRSSSLHTPPVKQPAFTNTWRQPLWNLKLFNTFFVWYLFVILNLSECVGILSSVTLIGLMDRQGAVNSSDKNGYAAGWHLVFGNYSCISYYFLKLKFIVWLNRLKNPPSCRRQSL